jgi:hypothetical protein
VLLVPLSGCAMLPSAVSPVFPVRKDNVEAAVSSKSCTPPVWGWPLFFFVGVSASREWVAFGYRVCRAPVYLNSLGLVVRLKFRWQDAYRNRRVGVGVALGVRAVAVISSLPWLYSCEQTAIEHHYINF